MTKKQKRSSRKRMSSRGESLRTLRALKHQQALDLEMQMLSRMGFR